MADDFTEGARWGYRLAWLEAVREANQRGAKGILDRPELRTIHVQPREGGTYSLYCFDCEEWAANTANYEMAKEGCFAHSHSCVVKEADA